MASEREITSTEKLLDVIRGGGEKSEEPKADSGSARGSLFAGRFVRKRGVVIGVDIDYSHVRFVRVSHESHNRWELLDYAGMAIPADISRGTRQFTSFLSGALESFCGPPGKAELWAMMPETSIEVRNITVPSVGRKELENVIFWSAKRELAFDEAETVFDYEIQGKVFESGLEKLGVLFYTAPRQDVEETRQLFESAGYPLTGLTIAPIALQNIFRTGWIPSSGRTIANLHIGMGWSRIDIFAEGNLVLTRGIKAGINSMAETLVDEYPSWAKQFGFQDTGNNVSEDNEILMELGRSKTGERINLDISKAQRLVLALSPDSEPEVELADEFGLDGETVFRLIAPALERLLRQVERTFEHYTVTMGRESINALYVTTSMNAYRHMVEYIGSQLGIECDILDPLNPEHAWVGGATEGTGLSERVAYVSALGLALSSQSRTLNLLYTKEDQKEKKKYLYANYAVLAVVGILLAAGIGWYVWLSSIVTGKESRVAELERLIEEGVPATSESVMAMVEKLRQDRRRASELRDRYLAAAVFGTIATVTPEEIKLIDVRSQLDKASRDSQKRNGETISGTMMIDGFVIGPTDRLDADLIAYVMKIQALPIFERVVINAKVPEVMERSEVLRFTLTASMEVPSS